MINDIKEYFHTRKCTGLQINCPEEGIINIPYKKIRFCEGVNYSFNIPLLINRGNIGCRGAERNLGFTRQTDDEICLHISENTGIPEKFVRNMLQHTPSMKISLNNVLMGITDQMKEKYTPVFFIAYVNPVRVMELIQKLAREKQEQPFISSYSLLSICGNVFVRGYQTGNLCVSFGCPESRKYGGVGKDEVAVGFTENLFRELIA